MRSGKSVVAAANALATLYPYYFDALGMVKAIRERINARAVSGV